MNEQTKKKAGPVALAALAAFTTFAGGFGVGKMTSDDLILGVPKASVRVHAVDLRKAPGTTSYTMQVYATGRTEVGQPYDFGGVVCSLDDAGVTEIRTLFSMPTAVCAAGGSRVDPKQVDVHGLDLRRTVNADSGMNDVTLRAYGNFIGADGGREYLPGFDCGVGPASALTLMNQLARACFMKAKGLAQ